MLLDPQQRQGDKESEKGGDKKKGSSCVIHTMRELAFKYFQSRRTKKCVWPSKVQMWFQRHFWSDQTTTTAAAAKKTKLIYINSDYVNYQRQIAKG